MRKNPLIANGGSISNILDTDAYGWDRIRAEVDRDGLLGLTLVDHDATMERLQQEFGDSAAFPFWNAYTGAPDTILPACTVILDHVALSPGWQIVSETHPDDGAIEETQHLNQLCDVAPMPAYFMRGDTPPAMVSAIRSETGLMIACATGAMRYHPDGPLAGWMFAGSVSVHPDHRRMGLGVVVNALLLRDNQAELDWSNVLEQARETNLASTGMIRRCGLQQEPGKSTIVISKMGEFVTR